MDWLFDNLLANMQGPDFLAFYATVAGIVAISAYVFIDVQDATGGRPPPTMPGAMDPYELAFLRGGVDEVTRTAVYALRRMGLVEIAEGGEIRTTGFSAQELGAIERRVFEAIKATPKVAALFKARDLREALQRLCGAYQQRLSGQQLLAPPEALRAAVVSLAVGVILLIALAGYKIAAANAHGRSNIGFLVAEAAAACILLVWIFQRTARRVASKRGKAFLAQAQLAYAGQASALLGRAGDGGAAAASALLLVGLFGFDILKGAPDAAFARAFAQSSGSGGDGGGGCGGGDGGGGCGGCGGGGE